MTPPPPSATEAAGGIPPAASPRRTVRRPLAGLLADRAYLGVTGIAALVAVALVAYLIYKTAEQTGPVWREFGVLGFITGTEWIPAPAQGEPLFGALPFLYGTVLTSALALVIAVPVAVGVALATVVLLPRPLRAPVAGVIDLLAAVPSVVFGFWGIVVLVPWARPALDWIAAHNLRFLAIVAVLLLLVAAALTGSAARMVAGGIAAALVLVIALTVAGVFEAPFRLLEGPVLSGSYIMAALVLAIMVTPIITAISREVLATVPRDQQEAAFALGATRWEMVRHSMLPWARSGIVGASALGLGRAMGETIALAMVLGNVPNIGGSLLGPGATAAGVIALETGEAGDLQLAALTALAVLLFALTFLVNGLARLLVRRGATGPGLLTRMTTGLRRSPDPDAAGRSPGATARPEARTPRPAPETLPEISRERRIRSRAAEVVMYLAVIAAALPLGVILGTIIIEGGQALSWSFFTEVQPTDPTSVDGFGIGNALVGTLILTGIALGLSAPLGILTALFLHELQDASGWKRRVGGAVGTFVDTLLGMPSIVAGLTVYLGIVVVMGRFSALAGGLALAIIMFPIVVRGADEVIRLVPSGQREAALALGAPRWRTVWSVVLPAAAPGIITAVVLALARAAGETAPLLFTSLGSQMYSTALLEPIAALPQLIFFLTVNVRTDESVQFAWGATLVLVGMVLALNIIARLVARLALRSERR